MGLSQNGAYPHCQALSSTTHVKALMNRNGTLLPPSWPGYAMIFDMISSLILVKA